MKLPLELRHNYNQFIWVGDNINKGVGIISFNDYQIKLSDCYTDQFKYIIPLEVTRSDKSVFYLFALWAMPDKVKAKSYVGQVWGAMKHYKSLISEKSILIGDFNSNQIWDKERKGGNHTHCVDLLASNDIESLYHRQNKEAHGSESTPTIYLLKQMNKPYHLDYCFASQSMITHQTSIEIGDPAIWLERSDHMPLVVRGLQ